MRKCILLLLSTLIYHYGNSQISTFDSSSEGWTTVGDSNPTVYHPTGGNPSGYIKHTDVSNSATWYWIAPSVFLGNKSQSFGKYFCFDFKTSNFQSQYANLYNDLLITGNGITIYNDINPSTNWTHYVYKFDIGEGWQKDSAGNSVNASINDIQNVLANISEVKIRGEYFASPLILDNGSLDNVTLCEPKSSILNDTICDGDSIFGYTIQGVYIDTFNTSSCCDSNRILNLFVLPTSSSSTFIINCNTYTWPTNGNTYTTSGIYINSSTNSNGCIQSDSLVLTINHSTSSSIIHSECTSYLWHGLTYTTSGIYIDSTLNTNGCLHTDTLILTIYNTTSSSLTDSACNLYNWNGTTYTSSGIYIDSSSNSNGCLHTDTLLLTIHYSTSSSMIDTACDFYIWHGATYTSSGIYIDSSTNSNGCLNADSLLLTVHYMTSSVLIDTACNFYTWHGTTYTSSGIYIDSSINSSGCLHTDTLLLTIHYSTSTLLIDTACDFYTWYGSTFTSSGIYIDTSTNINGCMNTDTLVLTIYNTTSSTLTVTACDYYTWHGSTYILSGTYIDSSSNANGCLHEDSLVLTINYSTSSSITINECNSYKWNGTAYNSSGIYIDSSLNSNGCSQIDSLILIINYNSNSFDTVSSCEQFNWNGTTYTTTGTYTFGPFQNSNGCDSTASIFLTINNSSFSNNNKSICEGEIAEGHTTSGIYSDTLVNSVGCDSIYTLNLTVHKNPEVNFMVSKSSPCKGDTITIQYSGAPHFTFQTNSSWYVSTLNSIQLVVDENAIVDALAMDDNGCSSNSSYSIEPAICCTIFVPNAFSPNEDGVNDIFKANIQNDSHILQTIIYNRWGQEIYSSDSDLGWDGYFKGVLQDIGTYFYLIKYKCGNSKIQFKKGDLLLLR